jgi:hypothetical protein
MNSTSAKLLQRLFDPFGRILTPEVARKLIELRFDRRTQAQISRLARRCTEGRLSDAERREYEAYVNAIDFIAILQVQARAVLKRPPAA